VAAGSQLYLRLVRPLLPLLLAFALAGCGSEPAETNQSAAAPAPGKSQSRPTGRLDRSHAGTQAPGALFEDPAGEPVSLADFRGKPLLVNLWATWCAPCVVEMPTLDALAERERDLEVLAVSQDMAGREKVAAFFAEREFGNLEAYLDPSLSLMAELRVDTLPTTILYDAQGREVWRMTGMEDWTAARAAGLLKEGAGGAS
jgi:thiol-disulfide isomerase/thioredoxin